MPKNINRTYLAIGAFAAIIVAVFLIYHQATAPGETINYDYKKIPAKGASRGSNN